jgi:F-type H+-transporting ATPase subunit epsilon
MHLEIVTPKKVTYKGDVDEITINTADGVISILPHHVNLFTRVLPGEMILKISDREQFLAITGGFLEISNNKVTILADYAIQAEEIEVEKVIAAQKRAEEVLKKAKEDIGETHFAEAEANLRRALLELHVANRRHKSSL